MRYAISDIHGNYDLLIKLLKKIKFSKNDKLYVAGDFIDKGKGSIKLVRFFQSLGEQAIVIMGNHEYDFSKYMRSLIRQDLDNESLIIKAKEYLKETEDLTFSDLENIMFLPFYHEEADFIMVHAGVPLDENQKILPLRQAKREELVYGREFKEPNVLPNQEKCVLFGHTPSFYISGKPEIIKYRREEAKGDKLSDYYKIHLDTGNYLTKTLGIINLDTMETVYENE